MATTTNYGWTTPDDTALVKDGAAAIRTLGSSIDTTTKNLNPSTTLGDIEYRSSTANVNTRLPLGTAGQVLKVNSGATAPEWATDASGMTNPMTTTGDTIYSSSGSTPARLAIGSTGNVLTVAGGVPTWAAPAGGGGMTLINAGGTTLTGASTTVSSIPGTYNELVIYITNVKVTTSGHGLACRFNGDSGANRHGSIETSGGAGNVPFNSTQAFFAADIWSAGTTSLIRVVIPQYANTSVFKYIHGAAMINYSTTTANMVMFNWMGIYNQTTAITSLEFRSQSDLTGGTVYVYGVK
jgi:hypothetical protein